MEGRSRIAKRPATRLVVDVQRHSPLWKSVPDAAKAVRAAAQRAIAQGNVMTLPNIEIAVALADDAMVRAANRNWRANDKPTNVLSFPSASPSRIAQTPHLGDIIIAQETLAREDRKSVV